MTAKKFTAEVAVVGGGPAGLVAALALAAGGTDTLLVAPRPPHADRRTTALLGGSVQVLQALGVWQSIAANAAPLKFLRLVDATSRLLRAPEVLFDARELDLDAFGYNVENETLRDALLARARELSNLRIVESAVSAIEPADEGVSLAIGDKHEHVRLVAAADGRKSICRAAAGIQTTFRALPQSALVLNLRHSAPHHDTSTEFHTEDGPFTFAPLIGNRSSLVCVVKPDEAEDLRAMDDGALATEIEHRAHSILGKMEVDSARGIFPLGNEVADCLAAKRIALVGEAGHVLPPIGAQGLNLGIRDAADLAELVIDADDDPGSDDLLRAYDRRRAGDVRMRALAVDFFNRSLMSDFLPIHAARGIGLQVARHSAYFRRALMRQGLAEDRASRLARGEAL